jgi:hypothetical protein
MRWLGLWICCNKWKQHICRIHRVKFIRRVPGGVALYLVLDCNPKLPPNLLNLSCGHGQSFHKKRLPPSMARRPLRNPQRPHPTHQPTQKTPLGLPHRHRPAPTNCDQQYRGVPAFRGPVQGNRIQGLAEYPSRRLGAGPFSEVELWIQGLM